MATVCKFGGSSLATADNIRRCCGIVKSDENRRFVVVSAPGKRHKTDKKVTDLLHDCYLHRFEEKKFGEIFGEIEKRFQELACLVDAFPMERELEIIRDQIRFSEANFDFVLSRGEYLTAKLVAAYLGYAFLDAAAFVRFKNGELDMASTRVLARGLDKNGRYVIPGFYGADECRRIKTFSRGGSDITGAIVASVFDCDLYENWTDVDGIYVSDPHLIENAKKVSQVSFRELREMSYMGASVLHAETLLPIYENPVPIVIKNSFAPQKNGTQILKKRTEVSEKEAITCITGKNDYTCIQISKMMLDKQLGFVKKATAVFEEYHINISHTHSGLDNLCFFVEHAQYVQISFAEFLQVLAKRIDADKVEGREKIALLAVIGHNLSGKIGILAKIFNALKNSGINVRTIYQSISECNVIIGVDDSQLTDSIKAIYQELIDGE